MVQVINMGPSRGALQSQVIGQGLESLSGGLGSWYNNYVANKDFENLENNPELQNKPYSERIEAAQRVARRHGKLGEKIFGQKMQIEQSKTLEKAFNTLRDGGENQDYLAILADIGPALLASGQGAVLSEIVPLFFQKAQQQASKKAAEDARKARDIKNAQPQPSGQENVVSQPSGENIQPSAEQQYRNPQAPQSQQATFPGSPLEESYTPEMTDDDKYRYAVKEMDASANLGNPIDYPTARARADQENEQIRKHNQYVTEQKAARATAQEKLQKRVVKRAEESDLLKHPESKSIAQKLALQASGAPDENTAWDYIRPKLNEVDNALSSLRRSESPLTRGGGWGKMVAALSGNYKDFETAIKDLQPEIEIFKKYGLYPELRNILTGDLGLGPEQTEAAIFPFNAEQNKQLDKFPKRFEKPSQGYLATFPGKEHEMPSQDFKKFKEGLGEFLNANPGVNLISLRGKLNQDKRYAWQDVSKAISELITDGIFKPDLIQEQQYSVVKEHPIPSLAKQFEYLWKGAK